MSSNANTESQQNLLNRPRRLHHAAWVTRDQEATRQFYEDVVGLPMTACWSEKTPTGREYCHTFFEIGDGGAVVFFSGRTRMKTPSSLNPPAILRWNATL